MGGHYRYNLQKVADAGYRVFAPTYLGYGRSQKPPLAYSQKVRVGWPLESGVVIYWPEMVGILTKSALMFS